MSDQLALLALLKDLRNILSDLIFVNGVIATEIIKITENTAVLRHGEEFLNNSSCIQEHGLLNERIVGIVKKYCNETTSLEKHVLKHLEK